MRTGGLRAGRGGAALNRGEVYWALSGSWLKGSPQAGIPPACVAHAAVLGKGVRAFRLCPARRGYIRGLGLSVNQTVHVPGAGDFNLSRIWGPPEPQCANEDAAAAAARSRQAGAGPGAMEAEGAGAGELAVLATADPAAQEGNLMRENLPDPLAGEQTWPTQEVCSPMGLGTGLGAGQSAQQVAACTAGGCGCLVRGALPQQLGGASGQQRWLDRGAGHAWVGWPLPKRSITASRRRS